MPGAFLKHNIHYKCTWKIAPAATCAWKCAPATDPSNRSCKAINMGKEPVLHAEQHNIEFFERYHWNDRSKIDFSTVHGAPVPGAIV